MVKQQILVFLIFLFLLINPVFSQSVVISSYDNEVDPRDEWTELLVVSDNTDLRNWQLQDNNAAQTAFQTAITFNNIALWNNLRAGTIIMIHHRSVGSLGNVYPVNQNKSQGYIEVSANDVLYFSGGSFGTSPLYNGQTLNIAAGGDLLRLADGTGTFIHALGHRTTVGSSWATLPTTPKLNHQASLTNGEAVFVCPGSVIAEFGTTAPQDGTTWTARGSGAALTFGLPNTCSASSTANSDFWRATRQPAWASPALTGTPNGANTQITLSWNAATDPFPFDATQGYLILRSTTGAFGIPTDGTTYITGNVIGAGYVVGVITSSQTTSFVDNYVAPCTGGVFYRVFAFRYATDFNGNSYNTARGRAYNETAFGEVQVLGPSVMASVTISSSNNPVCQGASVTFTATPVNGGTTPSYQWIVNGMNAGINSPVYTYVPANVDNVSVIMTSNAPCPLGSPATSNSIVMSVTPVLPVSVTIVASPGVAICAGTSVTFTATPVNGGLSPAYQWYVNGNPAGTNSPTYSFVPNDADQVYCRVTTSLPCPGPPANSNTLVIIFTAALPVSVTVSADPGTSICAGTSVTFTATPVNGGLLPTYQWYVNGNPAGTNSPTYSFVPNDADQVNCMVTSSLACAGPPGTSNTLTISYTTTLIVSVTISAAPGISVCAGTSVTYTAIPANGGLFPVYQWYVNGTPVGSNATTYQYIPGNGDQIYCKVTSSLACAGVPGISNTVTMDCFSNLTVSVSISANPGTTVCVNTPVTFTAIPVNGGVNPLIQWKVNGNPVAGSALVFTYTPVDGDIVSCTLASSLSCATVFPVSSNQLTMAVVSALPLTVNLSMSPSTEICEGTPVTFNATATNGGSSPVFEWFVNGASTGMNAPDLTITPANGDKVFCKVSSGLSCVTGSPATTDTIIIAAQTSLMPAIILSANPGEKCPGTVIVFTADISNEGNTPNLEWFVDNIPVQQGALTTYMTDTLTSTRSVSCRLTSSLTCAITNPVLSASLTIPDAPAPVVKLTDKNFLCIQDVPQLDAGAGFAAYLWQDGSAGQSFQVSQPGLYQVTVTDSLGCVGSDSVLVKDCVNGIYLPDAFSPDGDGLNDFFKVITGNEDIRDFSMTIFNRWGEMVFESHDMKSGWDGTFKGKPAPANTYIWKIGYKDLLTDSDKMLSGNILLIR